MPEERAVFSVIVFIYSPCLISNGLKNPIFSTSPSISPKNTVNMVCPFTGASAEFRVQGRDLKGSTRVQITIGKKERMLESLTISNPQKGRLLQHLADLPKALPLCHPG